MKNVFGSTLLTEPLDVSATELPSPNQLKNKILIKGKSFNKTLVHVQNDDEGDVSEEDEAAEAFNFSTKISDSVFQRSQSLENSDTEKQTLTGCMFL